MEIELWFRVQFQVCLFCPDGAQDTSASRNVIGACTKASSQNRRTYYIRHIVRTHVYTYVLHIAAPFSAPFAEL